MSIYTTLNFVCNDKGWIPNENQLITLCNEFHINNFDIQSFSKPLLWNDQANMLSPVMCKQKIACNKAVKLCFDRRFKYPTTVLDACPTVEYKDKIEVLWTIPCNVANDYSPFFLSIVLGDYSVQSYCEEETHGIYSFVFQLSGYNIPLDIPAYLDNIRIGVGNLNISNILNNIFDKTFDIYLSST